jgi:hypothetical protein
MTPVYKTQFSIVLANRRGELPKLADVMAQANINIEALAISDGIHAGVVKLVVADPSAARHAFTEAKLSFREQEVLALPLPNHPGALARLCDKLAQEGHSIDYVYGSTGHCEGVTSGTCTPMLMLSAASLKDVTALELAALWPGP